MDIDKSMLESLPVNSNEPMFVAAECFKDSLLEIGLLEDSAETARRAFLTLKKGSEEETMAIKPGSRYLRCYPCNIGVLVLGDVQRRFAHLEATSDVA